MQSQAQSTDLSLIKPLGKDHLHQSKCSLGPRAFLAGLDIQHLSMPISALPDDALTAKLCDRSDHGRSKKMTDVFTNCGRIPKK